MYAIIATGGKQYKVSEGDIITIEKLGKEAGEKVTFDQVLAVSDNGIKVGSDVANASVEASVVKEGRSKKVIVYKYKRRPAITRRTVTDRRLHRLRSRRSTLNPGRLL